MYAPVTPTLLSPTLPPTEIVAGEAGPPPAPIAPTTTVLHVRHTKLNVLVGGSATVAGALALVPGGGVAQAANPAFLVAGSRSSSAHAAATAKWADVAGRAVALQARRRRGWWTVATAHTGPHGYFRLRYRADRLGSERLRVRFAGARGERGSGRALGRLNVYRLVEVSWYGGGGSLACGGWLTSATMGVANKTLPCGTLVTLRYGGRTVRVPVIDRGPYVAGREYDLTEATKRALGFEGVGEVWATS